MELNFASLSHLAGAIAYFLLSLYILFRYFRRDTDRTLFSAALLSTIWLSILSLQSMGVAIPFFVRYTFEIARDAAWFGVLYTLLGIKFLPQKTLGATTFMSSIFVLALLATLLFVSIFEGFSGQLLISATNLLFLQVTTAIAGLLIVEQVWRNASAYSRANIKNLSIAIAALFSYDFFMYSDALLFQELSKSIWDARGAVNALAAPLIALTMYNSRKQPVAIHISRQMVFHTTTLVLAGVYLLFISAGGYYINIFGGNWGEALRVLFITTGSLALVLLITSPLLRARLMVFISKNFFDYKYDYRDEWIESTNTLRQTREETPLPLQTIRVLAQLVGSRRGAIWSRNADGNFNARATLHIHNQKFEDIDDGSDIVSFFKENDWIINLHEFMLDPAKYNLIEIPASMLQQEDPWLIVPLSMKKQLTGFVLLCDPVTPMDLNWENYDLLKIVAQQACSYLEQADSQGKLAEARQFEAVNKTSAFLVHDIKTIIAQLSLLVKNAEKHKRNPEFVDDMIRTTHHTVEKMDHLLQQIRNPAREDTLEDVELGSILVDLYQAHRNSDPAPSLEPPSKNMWVHADKEQLKSVIGHIVQNAIDATPKEGDISIATKEAQDTLYIFVQDSGIGMTEAYMKEQLFKPFSSTKGLTGMGIGVYQTKEYLRKIGGSISVSSQKDVGTCFTLKIPTVKNRL